VSTPSVQEVTEMQANRLAAQRGFIDPLEAVTPLWEGLS
jgi:hypothetical protein